MDVMSNSRIAELGTLIQDAGGGDVLCLRMGEECSWTSWLIIATVRSRVHMHGLAEIVRQEMYKMGMDTEKTKRSEEAIWKIIDGGEVVVSLMNAEARNFYALEERWFEAEVVFRGTQVSSAS